MHPLTEARIATLQRSMSSYYSNRIEGQQTHPKDIERALRRSFSKELGKARPQRLAVAHVETQIEMERRLAEDPHLAVFSTQSLRACTTTFTDGYRRKTALPRKVTKWRPDISAGATSPWAGTRRPTGNRYLRCCTG